MTIRPSCCVGFCWNPCFLGLRGSFCGNYHI